MTFSDPSCQPRVSVAIYNLDHRLPKKVLGAALGAVVAGLALTAGQAKALVVSVGGFDYYVTTFEGTYNGNKKQFNTPENFGVMPWWGDQTKAEQFAKAVGNALGLPNVQLTNDVTLYFGPYFAWRFTEGVIKFPNPIDPAIDTKVIKKNPLNSGTTLISAELKYGSVGNAKLTWAEAMKLPNVPGPLPVLGLAAAFGFSRKLRKRIKLHKGTSAVSTPPGS